MKMRKKISMLLLVFMLIQPISALAAPTIDQDTNPTTLSKEQKEDLKEQTKAQKKEEKILSKATLDDEFAEDSLIIVLKNENSKELKSYQEDDFGDSNIEAVEDLTKYSVAKIKKLKVKKEKAQKVNQSESESLTSDVSDDLTLEEETENFHQILKVNLKSKGKNAVLKAIKKLEKRDDILAVEPNYITYAEATPNDPKKAEQWAINKMSLPSAWDISTGSANVTVGVMDNGINVNNPDLAGRVNTSLSKDFTGDNTPLSDPCKHGTHVAGIIGAIGNNGVGVTGVCWNIRLVSLRVFDKNGNGNIVHTIKAIDYANAIKLPLVNYSGGYLSSSNNSSIAEEAALSQYSGLFVTSAGNDAINNDNISQSHYPSSYEFSNIIAVANTQSNDTLAPDSNYGATSVDLGAPGSNILSTEGNTYDLNSGTSMAAPQVTGVAALIMSLPNSDFSPEEIKSIIENNVDKVSSLTGKCVTGGRLNASKALKAAKAMSEVLKDGKFIHTTDNREVYVIVGGAPVHVTNWNNVGGTKSTIAVTRTELNQLRQYPRNGTFVKDINGIAYRFAGGAPIPIASWANIGGYQAATLVDVVSLTKYSSSGVFSHVRQYPADGTFVKDSNNISYCFAGGAPIPIANWINVGGFHTATLVDYTVLKGSSSTGNNIHVRQYPLDGTFVKDINSITYRFAGGAPIPVASWTNVGGYQAATLVDFQVLNNFSSTSQNIHVRQYPQDGTFVKDINGITYRFAGGAPLPVASWTNVGGYQAATLVDGSVLNNFSSTADNIHVRQYPADGTEVLDINGNTYRFAGGAPLPVYTMGGVSNAILVDYNVLDNFGPNIQNIHVRQYPADGTFVKDSNAITYRFAGGAPIPIASWANVGGFQAATLADYNALNNFSSATSTIHVRQYPEDGTFVKDINGITYRFAGGAPLPVGSWVNVGGFQQATLIDYNALNNFGPNIQNIHVLQYPKDGTFVKDINGITYRFAGGAPIPVASWTNVGGYQSATLVDYNILSNFSAAARNIHVLQYPKDGTFVIDKNNVVYRFAGGAPFKIYDWASVGGKKTCILVDSTVFSSTPASGQVSHVLKYPLDNTYVKTSTGKYFRYLGGIRTQVSSYEPSTLVDEKGVL